MYLSLILILFSSTLLADINPDVLKLADPSLLPPTVEVADEANGLLIMNNAAELFAKKHGDDIAYVFEKNIRLADNKGKMRKFLLKLNNNLAPIRLQMLAATKMQCQIPSRYDLRGIIITDLTEVLFSMIHSDAAILLETKATSAQWLRVIDEYIDYTNHLHRCDGNLLIAAIRHRILQEIADLSQDLTAEKIIDQAAILSIAKSFDSTVTTKERLKQLIRTDYKYNVLAALSMTLPGVPEKDMDLKNSIKQFESYLKEKFAAIDKGELLYSGKKIAETYTNRWQHSIVDRKPIGLDTLLVASNPRRNESFLSELQEESLRMLLYATKLRMEIYKQRIGRPTASVADLIDAKLIETEPLNPLTTQRLEIDKNSQPRWTIAKAPALDVTID